MSSGSGSGADQHLLALLRAIRLRQAAPDAVAAGVADTAAALSEMRRQQAVRGEADDAELPGGRSRPGLPSAPHGEIRPRWAGPSGHGPTASDGEAAFDQDGNNPEGGSPEGFTTLPGRDFFGRPAPSSAAPSAASEPAPTAPGATPPAAPAGPDAAAAGEHHQEHDFGPSGSGGFEPGQDEVGRPNRNRFSGLPAKQPAANQPAPHQQAADEQPAPSSGQAAAGTIEPVADTRPVGRPRGTVAGGARPAWATGEQTGGAQPHRVPSEFLPIAPPMVGPGARRTAGNADGMDPADDALLAETQRLLATSLTFAGGPVEVAERFRAALMLAQPELLAAIPGGERTQNAQLALAVTWLVHHLDRPPLLVDGCGRLGGALAACGVRPEQMQFVGAALAEAMRAGMPAGAWRQDFDLAWRSTWQHAYEWIRHGEEVAAADEPAWRAVVVSHERRRPDLAVIRLKPFLPMPFTPGQYARVAVDEQPGLWRPFSLSGAPRRDDVIELHVRAKTPGGVSGALVHRTRAGDRISLRRAEGTMTLPELPTRNLLMIAGDTGVAPLKALLTEMADTGDPRSAVLFWGVRTREELYDIDAITEVAGQARRATVVPVVSEGNPGPYASGLVTDAVAAYGEWSDHEVYLAGPPPMLAATDVALRVLGVAADHIHHDAPG